MNRNLLRGTLYTLGPSLWLWGLVASFWSLWICVGLIVVGMVAVLAAGFIHRVDEDCGFSDVPHQRPRFTVIKGEM